MSGMVRIAHSQIERRKLEIFVGIGTLGFGLWLLMPGIGMGTPAYASLIEAMPEWQWGVQFVLVGCAHLMAVAVNGRRWWTPLARVVMCAATTMLYALFAAGFWAVNPATTAVYSYATHGFASAWCMYFAAHDAARIWEEWQSVHT